MSRFWATCGSLAVIGLMTANAQAMQGCGAGFHLNGNGRCVPNRAPVVAAPVAGVAAATGAAMAVAPVATGVAVAKRCPIHYHMNANGVCRHN